MSEIRAPRPDEALQPHTLVGAYALDALDDAEGSAFERHARSCEPCSAEMRELQATAARLADAVQATPPTGLRERLLDRIATTPQGATSSAAMKRREPGTVVRRSATGSRWLAAAAAVLLVASAGFGVTAYRADQRADGLAVTAAGLDDVLAVGDALTVSGQVAGGGRATLLFSPSTGRAVFAAADLAALDPSRVYQMWAIGRTGAQSQGLVSASRGDATRPLVLPSGSTAFGVTIEPAGGSQQPTSKPVVLLKLPA